MLSLALRGSQGVMSEALREPRNAMLICLRELKSERSLKQLKRELASNRGHGKRLRESARKSTRERTRERM